MTPAEPAKRRIKVAVLIGTLEVGGAELDIVRNFPRLNRDEFEVVVVCFQAPGPLAEELEKQGIRVIARLPQGSTIPVKSPGSCSLIARAIRAIRVTARAVWWLSRVLRSERIDIAHFFLPHSYAYGMAACALGRVRAKRVMSRLSLNFYEDDQRLLAWLERRWLHKRIDVAIANSGQIVDELVDEGVPRERVRLLYNGIDTTAFERVPVSRADARDRLGIASEAFVMVAVGNLWAHKGHRELIDACSEIRDRLPGGWRLLIAGRDEEGNMAAYQSLVGERGLGEHICLLGSRSDVYDLLMAADIFVQPSHHEGLPNALLEAMAASLPLVASNVGGIPEAMGTTDSPKTFEEEDTGWLVPARDVTLLAEALLAAAASEADRVRRGKRARQRVVDMFSIERSVHTYEAIYRQLVSG